MAGKKAADNKNDIDWEQFEKFVNDFKDESDRAAVILGAAKLDSLLYQVLDRYFLASLTTSDELLDGDSPLATFSSRINICYRLGLITAEFAKQIHTVRKIRNSFAHETSGCSLETGQHADRLKSLLIPFRPLPFYHTFRIHFFGEEKNAGIEFRACLSIMAARLEGRLISIKPSTSDDAWNCILKAWRDDDNEDNKKEIEIKPSK